MTFWHRALLPALAFLLLTTGPIATLGASESTPRGTIVGGKLHPPPGWFKDSFLEIADDVDEASEAGKHVMLFFELNGCPYCDRMLTESFEADPLSSYIQENFDVIAINIQGDRDVAFNEELSVTEKELAEILKVYSTPAIIFLDEDNKPITRVNGYRAPPRFQQVLEYVATRAYTTSTLADHLQAKLDRNVYQLRDNPLFSDISDLSSVEGPLMLVFEDGSCYDCNEFHDGIIADPRVQKELQAFTVVRLDADSTTPIRDVNGNATTPAALVRELEMVYRPGVVLYADGKLLRRHDSLTFPHHFSQSLLYVGGGHYRDIDYRTWSRARTEALLQAGETIDLGPPKQQ